jgi:aspartate kinase
VSGREVVVLKFGGTSLEPAERAALAARTVAELADHIRPVVVVSAPGRAGSPFATDTLLELSRAEGLADNPAEVDALIACGELVSAALFALRLRGLGLEAESLSGARAGIATDGAWGRARITGIDPEPLRALTDRGVVPVVAGFQGDWRGRLATLGRGGSDLTAVALGAALAAPVVIFTDVDGVFTADPRLVAEARRLPALSYEDAALLSYRGAKVLHARAAELALTHRVEVTVTRAGPGAEGTRITDAEEAGRLNRGIAEPLVIGGVIAQSGRVQFTLELVSDPEPARRRTREVFDRLAGAGVSLDLIGVDGRRLQFTLDEVDRMKARRVLEGPGSAITERAGCSKVSVVGGGMHGRPGVMARVVGALYGAGVAILQSADSHNVISCLVDSRAEETAVTALHAAFFGTE